MIGLICFHGWALTDDFWNPLRNELATSCSELKFETCPVGSAADRCLTLDSNRTWFGVGHSFGFIRMLDHLEAGLSVGGLIAINGFTHFCKNEAKEKIGDNPSGWDPRIVKRMIRGLKNDRAKVITDFHQKCGFTNDTSDAMAQLDKLGQPNELDKDPLLSDLSRMLTIDHSKTLAARPIPALALASENDSIVDQQLSNACFAGGYSARPDLELIWHPTAQHIIPITAPSWCAQQILRFVQNTIPQFETESVD